jgi:RimK family alpha-L-glutamate ligase
MEFAVIAHQATETNVALAACGWPGARSRLLSPRDGLLTLGRGDVALNRLDISADLDGVEDGIWIVNQLEAQGVRVFNRPPALLAAHDKLITARLIRSAGVPHPRTRRLDTAEGADGLRFPVVAKPRFGSWGRDVEFCADVHGLEQYVEGMSNRKWWSAGAVVQELVPPRSTDLRIIVSGGEVVGAAARIAAPNEWRTNVALGGMSMSTTPPVEACELALSAARALRIDLAGVDLLPDGDSWVVLEVNGAVDMRPHYTLGVDVFAAALRSLQHGAGKELQIA